MRLRRDSRQIIENIIRRYPENKKEYERKLEELIGRAPENDGKPRGNMPGNPTEGIILQLYTPRMERIQREIKAVDKVYDQLPPESQKVVRIRFWSSRYKNSPYAYIQRKASYSERTMQRIIAGFITDVGKEIGEI